ncbi:hypothetical protein GBAR_LOCUS6438 [Geodia barretti]|uniref:Uncharacterized protein n=1 Tax=Geodia barretti TaxID=519541 RepID=A0AA35W700_GEOBA|nr:hypothetical protein GBAR_LOCUS6438 [Geodia barretti]
MAKTTVITAENTFPKKSPNKERANSQIQQFLTRHCIEIKLGQAMGWLVLVTLAFLAVMAGATPLRDSVDVQLVRSDENELEAWVTWGDEGMGVQINAKSNRLSIQSNRGEILIYGEKIDGSGTFYSAQGQSFFATETTDRDGTLTKTEYAVPSSMEAEAKEAFKQKKIQRMLGSLDQSGARQSSEGAIRELVQRPEIKILEETARILGERGVIGAENDGALLFYMTVMNMLRGREGHSSRRSADRETQSFKRRHRSLDTESEGERRVVDNQEEVLCLPAISLSPSVKSSNVPDCTEVTKTTLSTGGFWWVTTDTRTYTTTICPTPTPTLSNQDSEVLCLPAISPSPSVKSSNVPDCTEVTKTTLSTGGILWWVTTDTRTYTTSICPTPTPTLSNQDSEVSCQEVTYTYTICPTPTASLKPSVLSNPCITNTPPKTSVVPCPSPPPTDYDPPSNDTADYYPYSTDRCAIPIPEGVHCCREENQVLCEDCHHNYECKRGLCPLVEDCVGMCGRLCSC